MRLIVDPPTGGVRNMSLDEALVHAVSSGLSPNTLRFYEWREPTLSLGYFQSLEDRHLHAPSSNCPVVRRFSGGGAIMHDRELTYSLALKVDDRFAARELYTSVHQALLSVLSRWSIEATLFSGEAPLGTKNRFLCFERRTPGDVTFQGAKICGSAQRRVGSAVLQHGSLLLERSPCAPHLVGIRDLGEGKLPEVPELVASLSAELELYLRAGTFTAGNWSNEELEEARRWELERYGKSGWISRR